MNQRFVRLLFILLCGTMLTACSSSKDDVAIKDKKPLNLALLTRLSPSTLELTSLGRKESDSLRTSLIQYGKTLIGTPYRARGTTPQGFDCSGFTGYVYQQNGFKIPRSSREQFAALPKVDKPKPGDLVFFQKKGRINHVGIYVGDGKMIHSPQTGDVVKIESLEKPNWKKRYAGARSILLDERTLAQYRLDSKKALKTAVAKNEPKTSKTQSSKTTSKSAKTNTQAGKNLASKQKSSAGKQLASKTKSSKTTKSTQKNKGSAKVIAKHTPEKKTVKERLNADAKKQSKKQLAKTSNKRK